MSLSSVMESCSAAPERSREKIWYINPGEEAASEKILSSILLPPAAGRELSTCLFVCLIAIF